MPDAPIPWVAEWPTHGTMLYEPSAVQMADDELTYQGADHDTLVDVTRRAVAILTGKKPEDANPTEDGDFVVTGDSAGVVVSIESDPSALVFRSLLLDGVKESAALYALINEINADIVIGQMYFFEKESQIRYYYKYPAEKPSPELVACIISDMIDEADLYDDRLKVRLGGERFNEEADDEIEV
ncbi:YbjN domain-containing protein [Synechococcus sp. HJ21-Hayes]|uniref:T3SS (YopN, CesT) and YbjN peptide-binding chaperone 1 n=2 Tax=unclassified Synechococcus TaxID=2626047 RepID=UPI0020CCFADD|nr:YbjN domain-containing protein [Synechococcus sp. JJ3a-Johnson]MCP9832243.1 YbjN domain-containing protein [Synechococcus sp. JJ3a-Johnson]MCP9854033.1 YbjN domain-containing protein [Synechococcus sp. HJ21-Hayes]